jgi:hypothetical protein
MGITLPIPFVNEYYPYPTRLKWIHRILPIPYPFHVGTGSRIGFEYPATSRMVMPKDTIVPWSWAVSFFIYKRLSWFYRKHISEFFLQQAYILRPKKSFYNKVPKEDLNYTEVHKPE